MYDEWAIRKLLETYCRHVDDNDFDHVTAVFTQHAVLHFGDKELHGRDAIRGYYREVHGDETGPPYGVHLLGNCIIEITGSSAVASTDFIQVWRTGTGPGGDANAIIKGAFLSQIPVAGRYVDKLRKLAGEWLIAERTGALYVPNPFTAGKGRDG